MNISIVDVVDDYGKETKSDGRKFKEARVKDGYLVEPMYPVKNERDNVKRRRWRKETDKLYEEA